VKALVAHEHAAGRPWSDWQELARHLVTEHGTGPLAGHLPVAYYVREHAIEHHAIALYEAAPTVDEQARPWWTRPEDERARWLRMARDEMVAEEHDEHDALGRALYERRRPTGTPWDELDKASRDEWTVIAFDHEYARRTRAREALDAAREETGLAVVTSGTTATVDAQVRAVDTRDPELRPDAAEREAQVDPELRAGLRALFGRMEQMADEQDASQPHCLLVTDPQTSRSWVIGTFASRLEARVAIPLIEARYRRSDPDFVFTYTPMIFEKPPWENE